MLTDPNNSSSVLKLAATPSSVDFDFPTILILRNEEDVGQLGKAIVHWPTKDTGETLVGVDMSHGAIVTALAIGDNDISTSCTDRFNNGGPPQTSCVGGSQNYDDIKGCPDTFCDIDGTTTAPDGETFSHTDIESVMLGDSIDLADDQHRHGRAVAQVYNDSGATLYACTAVYISGYDAGSGHPEVSIADADANMPALGLVQADIANGAEGYVLTAGIMDDADTATAEGWTVGAPLYINDSGTATTSDCASTLTETRPANTDDSIQAVARVVRVNATSGQLMVMGAGRSNDVPNLQSAYIWAGNGSNVATPVSPGGDVSMDNAGAFSVLQIQDGTAPTVSGAGDIGIDTSDSGDMDAQLVFYDGDSVEVIPHVQQECVTIEALVDGDDGKPIWALLAYAQVTLQSATCVCYGTCTTAGILDFQNAQTGTPANITGSVACDDPSGTIDLQALTGAATTFDRGEVLLMNNGQTSTTADDDYVVCWSYEVNQQ
jgi:hypothetical protein